MSCFFFLSKILYSRNTRSYDTCFVLFFSYKETPLFFWRAFRSTEAIQNGQCVYRVLPVVTCATLDALTHTHIIVSCPFLFCVCVFHYSRTTRRFRESS